MKAQVIYFSKTGNTKKLAEAIASEIGVKAVDVKSLEKLEKTIIFMGSGSYGKKPGKEMMDFMEKNDFKGFKAALFGTSGSGKGDEVAIMEKTLLAKGASVKGKFFCKGKFIVFNRGRPSQDDLKKARDFARKMSG